MSLCINWSMVMAIEKRLARQIWKEIMEDVDIDQHAHVEVRRMVEQGIDRSALWRALIELAELGLIKKCGNRWDRVWVNPKAVHSYRLRGEALKQSIAAFEAGASVRRRKKMNPVEEEIK